MKMDKKLFLLLNFLLVPLFAYNQNIIWLETEKFENRGGWTNDWQFIDQMGSPYLMATGLGDPVKDASTRFHVDKPGCYRIWLRTLDWHPPNHPGKFDVYLNNKKIDKTFGKSGNSEWIWEDGGTVNLSDTNEIFLNDLT